jgi:hypothetical protein
MSRHPRTISAREREYSLMRIRRAIAIIEELAPLEQKRESKSRRKSMEKTYESLTLHADKLGMSIPRLSTFYRPEQYLEHARIMRSQLEPRESLMAKFRMNNSATQMSLWPEIEIGEAVLSIDELE